MWRLLRTGVLNHMSSDHAPSTLEQKADGGIWNAHFGLPGLDSTMAILIDAAMQGHLSFEDIARVYAEAPAQEHGLWPTKGRVAIGADADFALVDPATHRTLRNKDVRSKAAWTPFDGRDVRGSVVRTYLRGSLVAENGEPTDARTGQFICGGAAHQN